MASTSLNAKISTTGAAKAERELKGFSTQAKKTEGNVIDLGNGYKGATTQTKKFTVSAKDLIAPVKAGAVAVLTLSGAITGLVIATASQVTEQRNMAALSDQTIAGFNSMSFAASQFGVTNEQLSDQFKDVNEKIGEFLTTGGGGLQDYIDTMGLSKKAGMEFAQSLRNMSGQDALQLMINNMQSANKSTREMSFAVEGLASDLTKSLPLFLDNGKALKELNEEFALFTSPLTEEEVDLYAELNKNVALSQAAFRSLAENALIPVVGYVSDLAEQWSWFMASMNKGTSANLTSRMAKIQDEIDTLTPAVGSAAEEIANLNLSFSGPSKDVATARVKTLKAELQGLRDELNKLQGSEPPSINGNKADPLAPIKPTVSSTAETENDKTISSEKLEIQKAYNSESLFLSAEQYAAENIAFNEGLAYQEARLAEFNQKKLEDETFALEQTRENFQATNDLIQTAGSALSSSLSSGFNGLINGSMSAKEAALDVVSSVANAVIDSGINMLVQSLITDKIASAAFLAAKTAEVSSTVAQAGLNAFAATAAIPIVGPAAAPAAAAASIAGASALGAPVLAAAAVRAQGGQLSAGQDSTFSETGGMEILTPANSSRIRTAQQMKSIMSESGGKTEMNVTIINQGSGTSVTTEQKSDNEMVVLIRDTVSADIATPNSQIDKSMTSRGQARKR